MPKKLEDVLVDQSVRYFQPTTKLGHFSAQLSPAARTLTIEVGMSFSYTSMYFSLAHPEVREVPSHHDQALIRRFFEAAEPAVTATWNRRFVFVLEKTGWEERRIAVSFRVIEAELSKAHYEVSLSDPSQAWSNQAVVTEAPRGEGRAHYATFSADVAGPSGFDTKLESMVEDLVGGWEIPLPNYRTETARRRLESTVRSEVQQYRLTKELVKDGSPAYHDWKNRQKQRLGRLERLEELDEERALRQVEQFVAELRKVVGQTDYEKLRIVAHLRAPINRYGSLVEHLFRRIPWQERKILTIEHSFARFGSEERSITLKLRSAEVHDPDTRKHVNRIVGVIARTTLMSREGFQQITICHEFGHMLGLPDEYICLTRASRDLLKTLDINKARSEFSVEKWLAFQEVATGIRRDNPITSRNQVEFLALCREADVQAPHFGRKSSSLMSAGSRFLPCHGVTLWQCIGHLTAGTLDPEDWRIELLRE